jgi:phospholipase A1
MSSSFYGLVTATIAAVLLIAPGAGRAQSLATTIAECAGIAADSERLACYDRASGRTKTAAPAQATPPAESTPSQVTPAVAVAAPRTYGHPQSGVFPQPAPAVAGATAARGPDSLIDAAWGFDPDSPRYTINSYNQNYLLLARYTSRFNAAPFVPLFEAFGETVPDGDKTEAKFQISAKARAWTTDDRRWGLWAAYTQQSQWQVYNSDVSKPFRDTNYMPEAFVSWRPDVNLGGGFRLGLLNAGYNHQSNGRSDLLSRSWDRVFVEAGIERGNFALLAKGWYAFHLDDNPDITDYYGHGSLTGIYKWNGHSFNLMARGNLGTGKGAAQLSWTSPPLFGPFRAYVQGFTGYGESMIDYNWNQSTIGVGLSLNDQL